MFRLYEIEKAEEEEIGTRLLAQLHMIIDNKFPDSKAQAPDAFKETAFSIVEDTISDGEPEKAGTPGVPETRDSTPITKSSGRIGNTRKGGDLTNPFSNFNEDLGENTQFSLDEPTQVTESDVEIKERGILGQILNMFLILLVLLAVAAVAFFFIQKGL
jgi:hypothetical protein